MLSPWSLSVMAALFARSRVIQRFYSSDNMRVVGLISGGKDSIFNLLQCISAGHNIVALANIYPESSTNKDELDSFMYQTVGHEGINLIAEASALPLYRQSTFGKARCQALSYNETNLDEVEDLFNLLNRIKQEVAFDAVAVGAIASDYQRTRVENVCVRLGLTSLAYLWRQDQSELLKAMIAANIDARVIKVASMGLRPDRHLGMSIAELQKDVTKLNEQFGANICGEGGEYETFVLDCPLFHSKIKLDESEIISDQPSETASPGFLRIVSAHLEPKFSANLSASETLERRLVDIKKLVPDPNAYIEDVLQDIDCPVMENFSDIKRIPETNCLSRVKSKTSSNDRTGWYFAGNIIATNVTEALDILKGELSAEGMTLEDITFVGLWLRDMAEFAAVNREYVAGMVGVAPARACVATALPVDKPVLLEIVAHRRSKEEEGRRITHVQSYSHWAPANIGPYCQSVEVNNVVFVAGQIPMVPGSMALLNGPLAHQVRLCVRHADRLLAISNSSVKQAIQACVYVAKPENAAKAAAMVRTCLGTNATVVGIAVSSLPRYTDVEVQITATLDQIAYSNVTSETGNVKYTLEKCVSGCATAIACQVYFDGTLTDLSAHSFGNILSLCSQELNSDIQASSLRVFFTAHVSGLADALLTAVDSLNCAVTLVPVISCEKEEVLVSVVGLAV